MSQNIDALDQRQWHEQDNDARADHESQLAELQADADYAEHCERQRQQDLAAQMELDAMTRDASGQVIRPVRQAEQRAARTACNLIAYNARVTAMVMEAAFGKKGA
jgi:hypothetical protein